MKSTIFQALEKLQNHDKRFVELLNRGTLSVEIYKPIEKDFQQPHAQDEVYIVISGTGNFYNNGITTPFQAGDLLFVPAGVEHRFENFSDDFSTWVVFYGAKGGEKPFNSLWDFDEDVVLEDERVLLRPLQYSDIEYLSDFSINEPELWKYSLVSAAGKENMIRYIQDALNAKELRKEYPFIVYDKLKKQYAGSTRFYDIQLPFKSLQLGYTWYGKNFQGTGLNRHCKFLLLQFAFEKLGLDRVEFRADNRNERSKAAMLGIGCKVEGIIRQHLPSNEGGKRDSIILSILKEEWFDSVKKNLCGKIYLNLP